MSDQTKADLAAAIAAHVADHEPGQYVTDWIVMASSVGAEIDDYSYTIESSDGAPHVTLGLAHYGVALLEEDE